MNEEHRNPSDHCRNTESVYLAALGSLLVTGIGRGIIRPELVPDDWFLVTIIPIVNFLFLYWILGLRK